MNRADRLATGRAIAAMQRPDGSIPWQPHRHLDPWNMIEATMGLDTVGLHREAEDAYRWLASNQRADGSWCAAYLDGAPFDPMVDANFCAYIAAGAWHHFLATGEDAFLRRLWPTVQSAIDHVLELQTPDGAIHWARDGHGRQWPEALLTSSACIALSLGSAISLAERVGEARPDWHTALARLNEAVRDEDLFVRKERFAMDWYYPVLTGVVGGGEAVVRLEQGWATFVVDGRGCLCVTDRTWVTSGETAELVLSLFVVGMHERAQTLLDWVQHLRTPDGLYWTGINHDDLCVWPPEEKTSWSAGAVLLAADALEGGPTAQLFGDGVLRSAASA